MFDNVVMTLAVVKFINCNKLASFTVEASIRLLVLDCREYVLLEKLT